MATKRPLESLSSELEKARTRQRAAYGEVTRSIDAVIAELERGRDQLTQLGDPGPSGGGKGSEMAKVVSDLGSRVKALKVPETIVKENRDYHAILSKLGKSVDKHFIVDMDSVLQGVPDAERSLLHRSVAMHFLHRGQFQALALFREELAIVSRGSTPIDVVPPEIQSAFEELHRVISALEAQDVGPALAWLAGLPAAEQKRHSELAFELHSLRFTQLLNDSKGGPASAAAAALHYGRAELAQYIGTPRGRDVARLLAAVAFAEPRRSPYAALVNGSRWTDVARSVRRAYCEGAAAHLAAPAQNSSPPSPPPSPTGRGNSWQAYAGNDAPQPPSQLVPREAPDAPSELEGRDLPAQVFLLEAPPELPPFPLAWNYPAATWAFSQESRFSQSDQSLTHDRGGLQPAGPPENPGLGQGASAGSAPVRVVGQTSSASGGRVRGSAAPRATFSGAVSPGGRSGGGSASGTARLRHPQRASEERIRAMLMAQLLRRQASGGGQSASVAPPRTTIGSSPTAGAGSETPAATNAAFPAEQTTGDSPRLRYLFSPAPRTEGSADPAASEGPQPGGPPAQAWLPPPQQPAPARGDEDPAVPTLTESAAEDESGAQPAVEVASVVTQTVAVSEAPKVRVALPQHSLLSVTISAGLRALPRLVQFSQMLKASSGAGAVGESLLGKSYLPVEIDLGPGFHFHTTFSCAVSRSQTSRSNPPMLLACGHCISKACLDRLARVARGRTVKCPICPQHQAPQSAKRLHF